MINVLMFGSNGKMGAEVIKVLQNNSNDTRLMCGVDAVTTGTETYPYFKSLDDVKEIPDVIIDFSFHKLIGTVLDYAIKINRPVVVATTGFDESEMKIIREASTKIPVFLSANMSLGIALLVEFAKKTAKAFPDADIEIVETHHNRKVDAPSGTALMLARGIKEVRENANFVYGRSGESKREKNEIGIHALRMANIAGEHAVYVTTDSQQIVLKHTAYSRALFAEGAVKVASFMVGKQKGMYDMHDMIGG